MNINIRNEQIRLERKAYNIIDILIKNIDETQLEAYLKTAIVNGICKEANRYVN